MRSSLLGAALILATQVGRADPFTVVNALRTAGCGGQPGIGTALRRDPTLDEAARALSDTNELEEALERAGYPAASSSSFHVRGSSADTEIKRLLGERYCRALLEPRYDEVGVFARGNETWIVLGVREARPPLLDLEPDATAARVLELVNAARAEARSCGRERFEAAPPLRLSSVLNQAAEAHVRDMAEHRELSHRGSDGSQPGDRITRAGYAWQASGENIAAGQPDADTVVAGWLASPGHCAALMNSRFSETGIAFELVPNAEPDVYWAQVFAAP